MWLGSAGGTSIHGLQRRSSTSRVERRAACYLPDPHKQQLGGWSVQAPQREWVPAAAAATQQPSIPGILLTPRPFVPLDAQGKPLNLQSRPTRQGPPGQFQRPLPESERPQRGVPEKNAVPAFTDKDPRLDVYHQQQVTATRPAGGTVPPPLRNFNRLWKDPYNFSRLVLRAMHRLRYSRPTPIQQYAIPAIARGERTLVSDNLVQVLLLGVLWCQV
jgi:hypothetical protein